MIHPLIQDGDRTVRCGQVGDGVLGQDCNSVRGDHLRDSVVDLRVNMIGAAGKDDALDMVFFHEFQDFLTFFADIKAGLFELFPTGDTGGADLLCGDLTAELFFHGIRDGVNTGKCHKGIAELHFAVGDLLHVVADILRIGGDDRAVVMVVRGGKFRPLVEEGRIEDKVNALLDQPHDMSVSDLGRIAGRLTGDGFNAHLVDLVRRERGEDDSVSELCKESCPERIVLVHVQNAGNADGSAVCLVLCERTVAEDPAQLVLIEIGHVVLCRFLAETALTAVAGDEQALLGGRGGAGFLRSCVFIDPAFPCFLI